MKAVVLKAYGDVSRFSLEEVETPKPNAGEVLVRIAAASVNPIDWKLRSGVMREFMPLEFPVILGRDLAGEVAELGAGVTGFTPGQRVMAFANHTYAEYAVVKADELVPVPEGMTLEQAAALPLVVLTGAQLIEVGIKPKGGQSLLLTGVLGGVGRTAAYVARQHHAQVVAVVRPDQMAEAEKLGTLGLVAADDEESLSIFKDLDILADAVGGPFAAGLLKLLRPGAVYASVVGFPKEVGDYEVHAVRVQAKPDAARLLELATDVSLNRFKIPVAKVLRLAEVAEAHRLAEAGGAGGKIVLVT